MNSRRYAIGHTRYRHYYPSSDNSSALPVFAIPNEGWKQAAIVLFQVIAQISLCLLVLAVLRSDKVAFHGASNPTSKAKAGMIAHTDGYQGKFSNSNHDEDIRNHRILRVLPEKERNRSINSVDDLTPELTVRRQPAKSQNKVYIENLLSNLERTQRTHEIILITPDTVAKTSFADNKQTAEYWQEQYHQGITDVLSYGEKNSHFFKNHPMEVLDNTNRYSNDPIHQDHLEETFSEITMGKLNSQKSVTGLFVRGAQNDNSKLVIMPIDLSHQGYIPNLIKKARYQLVKQGWSTLVILLADTDDSKNKIDLLKLTYSYVVSQRYNKVVTISYPNTNEMVARSIPNIGVHSDQSANSNEIPSFSLISIDPHLTEKLSPNNSLIHLNKTLSNNIEKVNNVASDIQHIHAYRKISDYKTLTRKYSASINRLNQNNIKYYFIDDNDDNFLRRLMGWLRTI